MTLLFDENFPPRLPRALRLFGIDAQHSREHLAPGTPDTVVFEFLRSRDWVWVTHDKGVRRNRHERAAILGAGVGAFVLTGTVQRSSLEMLIFVARVVEEMGDLAGATRPPFIFGISDQRKFERLR